MPGILKTVNKLFPKHNRKIIKATELYNSAALQARSLTFYSSLQVPDTIEGRFDILSMHVALIIEALKQQDSEISQELFDYFMADMDYNLREMGVGDFSVGKHVKKLAANFLGVLDAYASNDPKVLKPSFLKNIYGGKNPGDQALNELLHYFQACRKSINQIDLTKEKLLWPKI